MINNSTITLKNSSLTYDDNGDPLETLESVSVECYVDFSNNGRKNQIDGENIVEKFKVFITQKEQKDLITFVPDVLTYESRDYNILNYEKGIRHIEITV